MKNHQFDLQVGESIRLGEYKVTLLEIDGDGEAVLEIDGPDGDITMDPGTLDLENCERELVLA